MDETLLYLAKTWHHFGIFDHNWTYMTKYLKTNHFKASKLTKIKNKDNNKIRLKY